MLRNGTEMENVSPLASRILLSPFSILKYAPFYEVIHFYLLSSARRFSLLRQNITNFQAVDNVLQYLLFERQLVKDIVGKILMEHTESSVERITLGERQIGQNAYGKNRQRDNFCHQFLQVAFV